MGSIGWEIRSFPSLPSTNDYLLALQPPVDGLVVVADVQTAGRGRGDHHWDAAAGENLLFSFSKTMEGRSATLSLLPVLIALSVCEATDSLGIEGVRTKWPNDLVFGEKKLCGILIESRLRGSTARVVAGIGVNVNQRSFAPDLADSATSLALLIGKPVRREVLLGRILDRLNIRFSESNHAEAVRRYLSRCSTVGRTVTFESPQGSRTGQAVGVDEQGRLLIEVGGRLVAYAGSEIAHVRSAPEDLRTGESQY